MAEVFNVSKSTISEHITNIFLEEELDKNSTVRKFRTVQNEGSREVERELEYFAFLTSKIPDWEKRKNKLEVLLSQYVIGG